MSRTFDITTLFLDIGGVLLTNGWDRKARVRAADKFGLDYEETDERHHLTFDTYEEGKFMYAQTQPFPEMIELMKDLKKQYNLRVAVVSNEGRELTTHRVQQYQLNAFVDFFVSSCFVHYRKPDADIYRMALDIAQASPEQVVYVDDRALFVEVAQGLGIRGVIHKEYQTTRKAMDAFGLSLTR